MCKVFRAVFVLLAMIMTVRGQAQESPLSVRGVVYDVGLMYNGTTLSVPEFNPAQVAYDMDVIAHILRCNAVRIEGEDINRLTQAAEMAHAQGMKVYFNPWKMQAGPQEAVSYMADAAEAAEKLRASGVDLVFVAGCEYSLFCKGAFPGDTFDERMQWLSSLFFKMGGKEEALAELERRCVELNRILAEICIAVRKHYSGPLTYSAGTWETVDWSLFDIVGVDYYRRGESDADYKAGVERYRGYGKPFVVMEVGCCAYEGASPRGGEAFAIFQGVDAEGNAIYEGGVKPRRSEDEQADYVEAQVKLLDEAGADGVFIYVFSYPIYSYSDTGIDYDMVSYALVKSFPAGSPQSKMMPAWQPKQAFFRLGSLYTSMADREKH